jgi:hypothetical protein
LWLVQMFFFFQKSTFCKLATRAGFQMRVHQSKGPPEGFFALLSSVQHAPISPGDQSQPLMVFCCVVGHQPRIILGIIFLHFIVFYLLLSHFLLGSFVPQAAAAVVAVDSMCYWYAHQLSSSTITAYFLSSMLRWRRLSFCFKISACGDFCKCRIVPLGDGLPHVDIPRLRNHESSISFTCAGRWCSRSAHL